MPGGKRSCTVYTPVVGASPALRTTSVAVAVLFTVTSTGAWLVLTRRSGELPISPKLLSSAWPPGGSTMPAIADGAAVGAVAVPPSVPAEVMPLTVPAGCCGSARL